jgi:hypothetical protein
MSSSIGVGCGRSWMWKKLIIWQEETTVTPEFELELKASKIKTGLNFVV